MRGNHAFERSEEKTFNKKYYAENKAKIADKKMYYREDLEKSRADIASRSHESYTKDPEKSATDSTAQSRESYIKDPEKSRSDIAARSRS